MLGLKFIAGDHYNSKQSMGFQFNKKSENYPR